MVKYQSDPLTFDSNRFVPPIAPALLPWGGGGACDFPVLPEIPVQVREHYRNRGAVAAGRSPGAFSVF